MLTKIHIDFRLNGNSFSTEKHLLKYIGLNFPEHFSFLNTWFSKNLSIKVKTSGTTGVPKAIELVKIKMIHSSEATATYFNLPAKTTALHCLSSKYIAGKMMWVRALHLGWDIEVVPIDSTPLNYTNRTFDFAAMVPLQTEKSMEKLIRIEKLIIGGAPISFNLEKSLQQIATNIYQTYGMTETITHIAVRKITDKFDRSSKQSLYEALPDVLFDTDDRNTLIIYAKRLSETPITTNDVVQLYSGTEFKWLGRYDNIINTGGVKIAPEEIEKKILPYMTDSFFISSKEDKELGERVILVIQSDMEIDQVQQLIQKANLNRFEKPKEIFHIKTFIYTENGKINRKKTMEYLA